MTSYSFQKGCLYKIRVWKLFQHNKHAHPSEWKENRPNHHGNLQRHTHTHSQFRHMDFSPIYFYVGRIILLLNVQFFQHLFGNITCSPPRGTFWSPHPMRKRLECSEKLGKQIGLHYAMSTGFSSFSNAMSQRTPSYFVVYKGTILHVIHLVFFLIFLSIMRPSKGSDLSEPHDH